MKCEMVSVVVITPKGHLLINEKFGESFSALMGDLFIFHSESVHWHVVVIGKASVGHWW